MLGWNRLHARKPARERYPTTDVRRAVLSPTLKAGGRIAERPADGHRVPAREPLGRRAGTAAYRQRGLGAAEAHPRGYSTSRSGDVLAVLDSSDYVELLRLQRINAERADADKIQAELDHEIARLALKEYRDGTLAGDDRGLPATGDAGQGRPRAGAGSPQLDARHEGQGLRLGQHGGHRRIQHGRPRADPPARAGGLRRLPEVHRPAGDARARGRDHRHKATLDYQTLRAHRHRERLTMLERTGRPLHDPGPARRLCHPRQRHPPLDPDRGRHAGAPGSEAVLPPRPRRHGGRRALNESVVERCPGRDDGVGAGREHAGPPDEGPVDEDRADSPWPTGGATCTTSRAR